MDKKQLKKKSSLALKWSTFGEILAKIITPVLNMVLARLLTPDAFGVVATVTMIISFADTISDSGFQKYLIQKDFNNDNELNKSANVAFTSNLFLSILLWLLIIFFNEELANLVGNSGLGIIFIISGFSLIITAFSSIYSGILKRKFEYKKLFYARIISAIIPFIVTIPLALLGFSYWSIIIGSTVATLVSTIVMKYVSKIGLKLYFSYDTFKQMLSFSMWSLIESIGTWLTSYIGTFIVGLFLSTYYLGLYKTTITSVNGIFAIITAATTSVIFSTLSRLQNNKLEYDKTYLNFINIISIIIIPLGFGIFVYSDLVTSILLGNQWKEVIPFVGIYGLICSYTLTYGQYCSEYFRGLGKPKYNVLMNFLHLIVLIPVLIVCSKRNFESLYFWRSIIKIEQILVYWLIIWFACKFNPLKIIIKSWKSNVSSLLMFIFALAVKSLNLGFLYDIVCIILCIILYFITYAYIFKGKDEIIEMIKMFSGKGGTK